MSNLGPPRPNNDLVLLTLLQRLDEPPCLPGHLFEGFIAGTLSPREVERMHVHLRQCVVCLGALARVQSMHADEPVPAPAAVSESTDPGPTRFIAEGLIGRSPALNAVRVQIERLLQRSSGGRGLPPLLIEGETGSGKGFLASLLHAAGSRASGPFVDVNCAAIPATLLESELFGYERGAFTGARRSKPGLFQTAHRGTIFLDEVGLLPETLQAKLLKVLEERAVRRVGGTHRQPVDVWVMSASNVDLTAAIRNRQFREDLYHRLGMVTLRLPPLRDRGEDILLLANHFLARAAADYGVSARTLSPDACAWLLSYSWPGNVRQLANLMERVALLSDPPQITAATLTLIETPAVGALDDAPADHIRSVLEETGWNLSRTAARLGIARNTLRVRIAKLGLLPKEDQPGP